MRICQLQLQDTPLSIRVEASKALKPHSTPVVTTAIDSTDTLLATGSADGIVKVWDIRGVYTTHTFHGSGSVTTLTMFEIDIQNQGRSVIGHRLAAGYEDGQIRVFDLEKRKTRATLQVHTSVVRALDFDRKSNALVSASSDKTVVLWSASNWKPQKTITALEDVQTTFFVDSGFLLTGGERGILRLWDLSTVAEIAQSNDANGSSIVQAMRASSPKFVLSVHEDFTIELHSLGDSGDLKKQHGNLPLQKRISGTHDEVIDFAIVGQHKDYLAVATNVEEIKILSIKSEETSRDSEAKYYGSDVGVLKGHNDVVICLDVDWSGTWMISGAKDNTARLWRLDPEKNSFSSAAVCIGHTESIGAIALLSTTPADDSIAYHEPLQNPPKFAITGSQDKTIKHWSIIPGPSDQQFSVRATYTRKAHDKDINAIDVSHDSTFFASASQDRTVKIWSVREGETVGVLRGHRRGVWSVKFSPKGTHPITSEGNKASNARGYALTGSGDKTVKIWNLSDYSCLRTFEGHTNSVLKVVWLNSKTRPGSTEMQADSEENNLPQKPQEASDSVKVASAAGDGLVKVWDVTSEELATTLDNHTDRVWALLVHPTSGSILSGGGDGVITSWKDTTSSKVAASAAASTARIEEDQRLQNFMRNGSYREAITLALQLNHPARLLSLFTAVVGTYPPEEGSLCGVKAVDNVIVNLGDEQLSALIGRLRDWNTNAKSAPVAQRVLWTILKSYSPARLLNLQRGKGSNVKDMLDAIKVYTERRYSRMEELIHESYLVDYTLQEMDQFTDSTELLGSAIQSNGINAI